MAQGVAYQWSKEVECYDHSSIHAPEMVSHLIFFVGLDIFSKLTLHRYWVKICGQASYKFLSR